MIGPRTPPENIAQAAEVPAAGSVPALDGAVATARKVLQQAFGFSSFRTGQEEVVSAVLEGRDVLCVMPTGAGKSLCYQVPPLVRERLALVVSPLIALMEDQVMSLLARGIPAAAIHSAIDADGQEAALDAAEAGTLRLLYVAPERFRSERFVRRMQNVRVDLVAVDEAHCISQWGHDFRPDYRRLAAAIRGLGRPQVLALTATATPEVQEDVIRQLGLVEPRRFMRGIVRPNLAYEVRHAPGPGTKDVALEAVLVRERGASLVYAATRRSVEAIAARLRALGLQPLRYHAGLPDEERTRVQRAFLAEGAPLLVATNAFGMGVDRPDIRQVVHYDVPRSVEAYVQESGRAGRDGRPAKCVLLYRPADLRVQHFFIEAAHPSRAVVEDVWRVLRDAGEERIEWTAEEIAKRLHVEAPAQGVRAALVLLEEAEVVRRRSRGEGAAQITVLPAGDALFSAGAPLPPGLARLLALLVERFGIDRLSPIDEAQLAAGRGVTEETVRRGLNRLHERGRIVYTQPFRGRATELRGGEDALVHVDFARLEERRAREEAKLEAMVAYAGAPGCRVRHLLSAFGGDPDEAGEGGCGRCDRCTGGDAGRRRPAGKGDASALQAVLEAVRSFNGRFGLGRLAQHLAGSNAAGVTGGPLSRAPTRGVLSRLGVKGAELALRNALDRGFLALQTHRLQGSGRAVQLVCLSNKGAAAARSKPPATGASPVGSGNPSAPLDGAVDVPSPGVADERQGGE